MKAVIIDYGMGNVASVQKALDFLKIDSIISNNAQDIKNAHYIILPGVGSFKQGMSNLIKSNLVEVLNHEVIINKKPFFGICLGMQLIAEMGTEPDPVKGLGWIKGKVIKITENQRRIPHLGWNTIHANTVFIPEVCNHKDYYFIHSYHFDVEDKNQIAAFVNYGENYVAAVHYENIFATQFHPEKSQDAGLKLLKHFFDFYA
jgi:glutamine amidotransferase